MTEEKALVEKKIDAPVEWGTRGEIGALADRLAVMLPNAQEMTRNDVMLAAQYCRMMDLNPFRGEVYFYKNRGRLCVVDGYKALTRWARSKAPYDDRYEPLPLEDGQIAHFRCWILRDDRKQVLRDYVDLGASFKEAYDMAATFGDGSVLLSETVSRKTGEAVDPPVGWTWEQVARKRALKNCLNLSHGAPSPKEMAEVSWTTGNGIKTIPEDWDGSEELTGYEAEKLAELKAHGREQKQIWESLEPQEQAARAAHNSHILYGDPEFEGFDTPPEPPPETVTATQAPIWDGTLFDLGQDEPEPLITRKARLSAEIKETTGGYYNHWAHVLNGIRLELGDDWQEAEIMGDDGYARAKRAALAHAEKQG